MLVSIDDEEEDGIVFSFSSSGLPMFFLGEEEEVNDFCRRFMILLVGDFGRLRVVPFALAFDFAFALAFAAFEALSPRSDLDLCRNLEIDLDLDLDLERERKDRTLLLPVLFSLEQLMSSEEAVVSIPPWFPSFINADGNRIFILEGFSKGPAATTGRFLLSFSIALLAGVVAPMIQYECVFVYFFRSSATMYWIENANLSCVLFLWHAMRYYYEYLASAEKERMAEMKEPVTIKKSEAKRKNTYHHQKIGMCRRATAHESTAH